MQRPVCQVCGRQCDELEPAFRLPDAVFAVPGDERAERVRQSDDFVAIDGCAFFIRGVVPIPVAGRAHPYCWGFWAKVAREHFEEYQRFFAVDPPLDHPGFPATLANQTRHVPASLGLSVHVQLGRGQARPSFRLLDDNHPLARQQAQGVTDAEVHAWSSLFPTRADPLHPANDPPAPQFTASLDDHGWCVAQPQEVGKPVARREALPRAGETVKAPFVFLAADEHGDLCERVEYMWVLLDEVREDGWWSGNLNNHPFVPGPLECGTRVWLRAEQVLAYEDADRSRMARKVGTRPPGPGARLGARLARWWHTLTRRGGG